MSKQEHLFENFSPVSKEEWKEKIIKDLKGADYDKKLVWKTIEGFNVEPVYNKEDLEGLDHLSVNPGDYPFIRGNNTEKNSWLIRQDFCINSTEEANKKVLSAIKGGVNSIGFHNENTQGCPYSEALARSDKFKELLKDINLEEISINYSGTTNAAAFLTLLDEFISSTDFNRDKIKGSVGYDPISYFVINGKFHDEETVVFDRANSIIELTKKTLPNFKVINVNCKDFHNAGSSIVQELGFGLSMANEYLALLTERGQNIDNILSSMQFNFAVGSNYFMEIAKFRAARLLWSRISNEYNPSEPSISKMFVHAETSNWNKTIYDPYVNMLRTTTEAMSSILGGIDSLNIQPFDKIYKKPDNFSERIARNQQIVLKEEAYFNKNIDPAGGAYYIESLTDSITNEAWKLFLEIENEGGFIAAFKHGSIQKKINKTTQERNISIANKKEIFLGTNQYANQSEKIAENIDLNICFSRKDRDGGIAQALTPYRGAEAFEELRLRTESHNALPNVFLFTIGNLTMRKARAAFSSNFFGCAGYNVIDNHGFASTEDGIKDALKQNANIVVICSSDDEYPEFVPAIADQLKDKAILVVAGYPKDHIEKFKEIGIEHFIHMKSNLLESLKTFHQKLGIK